MVRAPEWGSLVKDIAWYGTKNTRLPTPPQAVSPTLRVERRRASTSPRNTLPRPRPGDRSNPLLDGPRTDAPGPSLAGRTLWSLRGAPPPSSGLAPPP